MNEFFPIRVVLISLALVALLIGQSVAFICKSPYYWPFNEISPFRKPPVEDSKSEVQNMVAVTSQGEIDVSSLEGVDHRILRRWYHNLKYWTAEEDTEKVLSQLLEFIRSKQGGKEVVGVRIYDLQWDLKKGEIIKSSLVHEFLQ